METPYEKDPVPLAVPDIGDAERIELVSWNVREGESVDAGQELCELVTEKAAFPLESPDAGVVEKIERPAGSIVKVGETLITLRT